MNSVTWVGCRSSWSVTGISGGSGELSGSSVQCQLRHLCNLRHLNVMQKRQCECERAAVAVAAAPPLVIFHTLHTLALRGFTARAGLPT